MKKHACCACVFQCSPSHAAHLPMCFPDMFGYITGYNWIVCVITISYARVMYAAHKHTLFRDTTTHHPPPTTTHQPHHTPQHTHTTNHTTNHKPHTNNNNNTEHTTHQPHHTPHPQHHTTTKDRNIFYFWKRARKMVSVLVWSTSVLVWSTSVLVLYNPSNLNQMLEHQPSFFPAPSLSNPPNIKAQPWPRHTQFHPREEGAPPLVHSLLHCLFNQQIRSLLTKCTNVPSVLWFLRCMLFSTP
jgi:hypothetical protein